MRNKMAIVAAAALPLILSAAGASASEPQFQIPATDRAQQTQPVLTRAAHAINAAGPRAGEGHISNLWLFPTAEQDTVFAQYTLTTNQHSSKAEEHLEVLKMKGNRIVERRDLTR